MECPIGPVVKAALANAMTGVGKAVTYGVVEAVCPFFLYYVMSRTDFIRPVSQPCPGRWGERAQGRRRAPMDTGERALVSVAIEKLDEHAAAIRAFDCEGGFVSDQDRSSPRQVAWFRQTMD